MTTASVVICAYTEARWDSLAAGARAAAEGTLAPLEVIVACDHAPELEARVRAELPWVVAVANDGPRGLSGARNAGLARARGDVVAFLDDDALPSRDWLERLIAAYRDPRVVGVGGTARPVFPGERPAFLAPEFDWVVGCTYRGLPDEPGPVRNLIGANMSFRRAALTRAGGFVNGIGRIGTRPVGCEETELCIRLAHLDPRGVILFDPSVAVDHFVRHRGIQGGTRVSMEALSVQSWEEPEGTPEPALADLTVVIPARNAEHMLDHCLGALRKSGAAEVIVVDGQSGDETARLARALGARVLSDEGRGLPAARAIGARAAKTKYVALVDADVVIPEAALAELFAEFQAGGYTALQAGLHSVGGPGYWGRALAYHHRTGRSKNWFGVVATIFERHTLLEHGFDTRFLSGEDIDLRWRLKRAGAKIGVSKRTIVEHRFDDTFAFALGQWLADGHGLARMLDGHGSRAKVLLGLPLAAGIRGALMAILRAQPQWLPYYALFVIFNYVGIAAELFARRGVHKT